VKDRFRYRFRFRLRRPSPLLLPVGASRCQSAPYRIDTQIREKMRRALSEMKS
jgi:hypothetical protein